MPGPSPLAIAEVQVGAIAYLWGITNDGTQITISPIASFEFDSDDLTSTWTEKEHKDTTGNVQNITKTNFKYERTIKIFPSGATRAAAVAVIGTTLAAATITVAHYAVAAFNGTWRIRPGTQVALKAEDDGSISLPVELYINAAQNAALTGAPIAG